MEGSGTATFVIALVGLVFSVVSVCWQIANYFLHGPRLRVHLRVAVHDDATLEAGEHYSIWSSPARRSGTNLSWLSDLGASRSTPSAVPPRYTREAFIIRVVNVGRTPVSVFFPNLWFDRRHYWGVNTRPFKFEMNGFYLLNPGETRDWIEPMWPGIEQYRTQCPERRVVVRAVVALGDGRTQRSPWRNAWKVPDGMTRLLPDASAN
ncbi:hypothetical protein ACFQ6E_20300 [Streptomyces sp. NPDC056462]|uniref:hypothetical protein n=1 Tax=Streptomyces sp. NPDC056462 TaxID=3345826 RepID=UPI0036996DD6